MLLYTPQRTYWLLKRKSILPSKATLQTNKPYNFFPAAPHLHTYTTPNHIQHRQQIDLRLHVCSGAIRILSRRRFRGPAYLGRPVLQDQEYGLLSNTAHSKITILITNTTHTHTVSERERESECEGERARHEMTKSDFDEPQHTTGGCVSSLRGEFRGCCN